MLPTPSFWLSLSCAVPCSLLHPRCLSLAFLPHGIPRHTYTQHSDDTKNLCAPETQWIFDLSPLGYVTHSLLLLIQQYKPFSVCCVRLRCCDVTGKYCQHAWNVTSILFRVSYRSSGLVRIQHCAPGGDALTHSPTRWLSLSLSFSLLRV